MVQLRYAAEILAEIKKVDPNTSISIGFIKRLAKTGVVRTRCVGKCTLIALDDVISFLEGGEATKDDEG